MSRLFFRARNLEPTINVGMSETHAEDQGKLYENGMYNEKTRLHQAGRKEENGSINQGQFRASSPTLPLDFTLLACSRFCVRGNNYTENSRWTPNHAFCTQSSVLANLKSMNSIGADDAGAVSISQDPPTAQNASAGSPTPLAPNSCATLRTVGTMSRVGTHVHFFQSNCSILFWLSHPSVLSNRSRSHFHLPANNHQLRNSSRAPNKGFWLHHLSIDRPLPRLIFV